MRAEGLIDGFWNQIVDAFFIGANPLISIDRKEVETFSTGSCRFDTVFVPGRGLRSTIIPLGFMEVKPPRYQPSTKPARTDFEKVVKALRDTLRHLNNTVDKVTQSEIVLIGVLCDGKSIIYYLFRI